jgi:hypothetical protein
MIKTLDEDRTNETHDPVLSMLGVGRHLWEKESGEKFIERLRAEDLAASPSASGIRLTEELPGDSEP